MVLQDIQVDKAVQAQVDDRLGAGGEPLDPVLGVSPRGLLGDLLQNRVEDGVANFRLVQKDEGLHVRVDTVYEGQFGEYRTDDRAVQVPARHLVKVAGFLVQEHQDEFLGQAQ